MVILVKMCKSNIIIIPNCHSSAGISCKTLLYSLERKVQESGSQAPKASKGVKPCLHSPFFSPSKVAFRHPKAVKGVKP